VPQDKWSFSMTQKEYEDYSNQKTTGFGFGYTVDFTIYMVRIDAPAWNKLLRGDKILEINGEAATKENIAEASQNLNVATTFTVLRAGTEVNVVLSSQEYTFKVTAGKTFTQGAEKVGYLRYDSFTGTSVSEFEAAFTQFKADAIQELIVDLRYNGGGSIDTASVLLENFTNQYPGERQVYLDWNVNYQSRNSSYYFSDEVENNDLDMKRVIFLVTKNSASASELVISALKPYL
jgi:C-terminal processing protease CtpA/Prc